MKELRENTTILQQPQPDMAARTHALNHSAQKSCEWVNTGMGKPYGCLEILICDFLLTQAIDRDAGASITYSIPAGQTEARLWQVNPITGEVTAIRPIKYADVPDATRGS